MKCKILPILMDLRQLLQASENGDLPLLHQLLTDDPQLLHNAALASGENPLYVPSAAGHVEFVKVILERKPSLAKELSRDGFSPMHVASANGYVEIVRAMQSAEPECRELKGKDQWTPLHCAARRGRVEIIREIVSACPERLEDVTVLRETVLHLAVRNSQFEAITVLLELLRESDKLHVLNMKDSLGNSVLHLATAKKQHRVVEWLVGIGDVLEVDSVNQRGLSPLDVLLLFHSEAGDREIEAILRGAGSNPRAPERVQSSSVAPSLGHNQAQLASAAVAINPIIPPTSDVPSPNQNHIQMAVVHPVPSDQNIGSPSQNNTRVAPQASVEEGEQAEEEDFTEYFTFHRKRDSPSDVRTVLLVVAVLVATASYEIALNPPGGLWSDTNLSTNGTEPPHLAGTSNIASYYPVYTIFGAIFNCIGFSVALQMIYILTTGFPLRVELIVCGLAMYVTYINGLLTISPGESAGWYSLFILTPALPPVILIPTKRVMRYIISCREARNQGGQISNPV